MPILLIDWLKRSEKAVMPCKHGQNAHKQHIHHLGTMQFRGGNAQSHLGTMQFWGFGRRAQVVT